MSQKIFEKIMGILILIMVIFTLITAVFVFSMMVAENVMDHNIKTIEIECYDKLGYEINDLTCDKQIKCNYKWEFLDSMECEEFGFLEQGEKS